MRIIFVSLVLCILTAGCKEKYNPPVKSPPTGYLVVEGFINNGSEPTTITLSRTTPLEQNNSTSYEVNAQVTIEGNNGESYPLYQSGVGVYSSSSITLNTSSDYRLHIVTSDGREYASDYTPVKATPDIDSITWQRDNGDLQMYVNAHDPQGVTKYYQWQYVETWEFHSAYPSFFTYATDPITNRISGLAPWNDFQTQNTAIYTCWHTLPSTSIVLGSTEKLITGTVHLPLVKIEQGDQKLSVLYHIQLQQVAVSSGKYQFLQRMKKNTETLGSIFDAQPSELNTNLHCLSDPAEQVIGYVEVSQGKEQTLFISNKDLPGWGYSAGCSQQSIPNNADSINILAAGLDPTTVDKTEGLAITRFFAAEPKCVDCTLTGTNVKPSFWP